MKHITILALDGTIASTVTGPTDIFSLAGVLWKQICGVQPEPYKTFVRRKKPICAIILSTQLESLFVAPSRIRVAPKDRIFAIPFRMS